MKYRHCERGEKGEGRIRFSRRRFWAILLIRQKQGLMCCGNPDRRTGNKTSSLRAQRSNPEGRIRFSRRLFWAILLIRQKQGLICRGSSTVVLDCFAYARNDEMTL